MGDRIVSNSNSIVSAEGKKFDRPLILVADDEVPIRLLARQVLEEMEFHVVEAGDGEEALAIFESLRPDVVLLDVMMPKKDGFAVCAAIRGLPWGEHTPILMLTGLDDVNSIRRAYEVGATDFMGKPFNCVVLGHRILHMYRANSTMERLQKSQDRNRALLNAIPDIMFQVDKDGLILDFNAPQDLHPGLDPSSVLGKHINEVSFFTDSAHPAFTCVGKTLASGEAQVFEHEFRPGNSSRFYESRFVVSGKDEVLAIVRDVTERKNAEEQVIHLAYHDTLTGLLNRHSFKELLKQNLAEVRRYNRVLGVLYLDLDRFKRINDTLGHNSGDLLLQGVADRLVHCVRKSDCTARPWKSGVPDNVARLGGDEFIILLSEITHAQDAAKVARRILDSISQAFMLAGHEVFITASVGITVFPTDGEDADTLLKNADTAMYHAKEQGRNNYQFYTESMNATAFEQLALENELRKALDRREFLLCYQPQLDIHSGGIVGVEALIRWTHPDMGLVPPVHFIPLAEETGLIVPIGEWVLDTACAQNKAWQTQGLPPMRVTVNLSSHQFRQRNLIGLVTKALETSGLDPAFLEVELTESAIMQNAEAVITTLHRLKSMGLRLAIDDFGTGYSSLSYLKRFPLDTLKIDRSFVRDITSDPDDAAINKTIIAMARNLNLTVIAEGVETQEQLAFLKEHGCDQVQGYLFSPPVPADIVAELVRSGKTLYG